MNAAARSAFAAVLALAAMTAPAMAGTAAADKAVAIYLEHAAEQLASLSAGRAEVLAKSADSHHSADDGAHDIEAADRDE